MVRVERQELLAEVDRDEDEALQKDYLNRTS